MIKFIKVLFLMGVVLTLTACTNPENHDITFEQRIQKVLDKQNIGYDVIVDYDIKDDFVIVFYRATGIGSLSVSILKQNQEGLELILSQAVTDETTVVGDGETPYITVVQPEDSSVKQVEVLGTPARLVTYIDSPMEGVTLGISYWVAYSYTLPDLFEDIRVIRE